MSKFRRIFTLPFLALVVSSSSVISFGATAGAEPMPISQAQQMIEQRSQVVALKESQIKDVASEIDNLEAKKQSLAEKLDSEKQAISDLQKKLAEKKAAAEAEKARLEKIKSMFVDVNRYAGNSAGNTYAPGYCTWYAKSRRPDLPNGLGNANMWYANAAAQGFAVGSAPKKGAIAQAINEMHVAYVEGVSLDGSMVTISEMNYGGLYRMNTRTVPAYMFKYIYELN